MHLNRWITMFGVVVCVGCGGPKETPPAPAPAPTAPVPEVEADSETEASAKEVIVVGVAGNAKLGAMVSTPEGTYYVAGMPSWADDVVGMTVRVRGTTFEGSVPVVTQKEGEPIRAGVVVPEGIDGEALKVASSRTMIKAIEWSVVTDDTPPE